MKKKRFKIPQAISKVKVKGRPPPLAPADGQTRLLTDVTHKNKKKKKSGK